MERYPAMFQAMREALVSDTWKQNVRFVGYGAFGPSHFGRWEGWKEYSLITDQWTSPDWHIWDGGSPSYYTHNWCDIRDHWVWSPQVESMNWICQLDEAWQVKPDFWWEVSLWDGNSGWTPGTACTPELAKKAKACQYLQDGQTYPPERFLGWAQFGLWLLRPRVIREFRGSTEPLEPWRPTFEQLLRAVDRVHANPTLACPCPHLEVRPTRPPAASCGRCQSLGSEKGERRISRPLPACWQERKSCRRRPETYSPAAQGGRGLSVSRIGLASRQED